MDIVEVSPPYDHAETTAMIANRAALEAISALAVQARRGRAAASASEPGAIGATGALRGTASTDPIGDAERSPASTTSTSSRIPAISTSTSRSPPRTGGPVLELAAGTGRIAVPLAAAGHDGHGGRPRPGDARPRPDGAEAAGQSRPRRLELVEADLLDLDLPTAGTFALAFIALNSLFLLATRDAQRRRVPDDRRRTSRPGGLAVVDVWLPDADDLARFDGRLILEYDRARPRDRQRRDQGRGRPARRRDRDRRPDVDLRGGPARASRRAAGSAATCSGSSRRDELRDFARTPGWRSRSIAGDYDLGRSAPGSERAILVAAPALSAAIAAPRTAGTPGPGAPGRATRRLGTLGPMASSDQTRLLLVEDVPQVAQYIRGLLNSQTSVKLLDVITDGSKVIAQIQQLRPDVVIVDALLQGQVKGLQLAEQSRRRRRRPGHRPDRAPEPGRAGPGEGHPRRALDAVLGLRPDEPDHRPCARSSQTTSTVGASRIFSVFAPKGGVGKTTIAFNLAVALGQLGQRTVLIDGSLQFGDLRALLKVPADAPSILDLPTDRVAESDLQDVLWRDPSGIDILLAPPRVEMAEMITARDVDKVLSLLRRVYGAIVIDMSSVLNDINLGVPRPVATRSSRSSRTTRRRSTTRSRWPTRSGSIGYPPSKVRYLVNRADSPGGIDPATSSGRSAACRSTASSPTGMLVVQSNNEGVPFVLANPAAQISQDIARVAAELLARPRHGRAGRGAGADGAGVRPAPDRLLRLRRRRADRPARGPPPVARTSRRSTSATTPARRTGPPRRRGPALLDRGARRARRRATSRRSSSPATPRPPSA